MNKMNEEEQDPFRLGFLLDAATTEKLLDVTRMVNVPPDKIISQAIHKLWSACVLGVDVTNEQ